MNEKLEDFIHAQLPVDDQKTALDFVSFLKRSKLIFVRGDGYWKDKIYYHVKFRNHCICFIVMKDSDDTEKRWTVWSDHISSKWLEEKSLKPELWETAWKHVDLCANCGSCGGGKPKTILGRKFEQVCGCTFRIDNPTQNDLPFMKEMVRIRMNEVLAYDIMETSLDQVK